MRVAAVVLAAGKSSRMGSNKLLLELDGTRVIDLILNRLEGIHTIVVTGHRPEDISGLVESRGVQTTHNPRYELGMTTSFQTGIKSIPGDIDAVFMVLSDTFGFKHEILSEMQELMESEPSAKIVSPMFEGKRGHPVLFRREILEEFLALDDSQTMKDVVKMHEDNHLYVEGSIWTNTDLDTPEDYERVKRLWGRV